MKKYVTIIESSKGLRNGSSFDDLIRFKIKKYQFNKSKKKDSKAKLHLYEYDGAEYKLLLTHTIKKPAQLFIATKGIVI
jgi:hypothetical protein